MGEGLHSKTQRTSGLKWNPLVDFTLADVDESHQRHGFERNETYSRGMSRHSCKFCIMAGLVDLITASNQPENAELYRELVQIEIISTFSFQSNRWLGDIAPHLLDSDQVVALAEAKQRAAVRRAAEARIPRHLRYTRSGWPVALPSPTEAQILADVRRTVAGTVGILVRYTTGDAAPIGRCGRSTWMLAAALSSSTTRAAGPRTRRWQYMACSAMVRVSC